MPFLDWVNKNQAKETPRQVAYHLLQLESTHGDPVAAVENLLIQGDNLLALKALLPSYAGRVNCIFIDPPYNTKSAFEHYDDNLEHSQWLSLLYPRLVLLRDLLSEDGSIWVTIDDNEAHYLKTLMDEVFGRKNFVADLTWRKRVSPANDAHYFSSDHDHILVFSKQKELWRPNKLPRSDNQKKYYTNPDNDPRGPWNSAAYTCAKTADERPNLYYPLIHPTTGAEIWPKRTRVWAYSIDAYRAHVKDEMLYWGVDGRAKAPRLKKFLTHSGDVVPRSVWDYEEAGHTQEAMLEGLVLFGDERFGTPKPERLLERILRVASKEGDIVLDSFLGSGTTAAVAHKMGRRYVGIEMGAHARTHCLLRLKKVIEGEQGGISKAVDWQGGGGFSFYSLGDPAFDESGRLSSSVRFKTLAAYIWWLVKGRPDQQSFESPLLGVHDGKAYFLLYNGILGDRRPEGGNVLTNSVLAHLRELHPKGTPMVVYGETSRLGPARLAAEDITFKQIPYDVKLR